MTGAAMAIKYKYGLHFVDDRLGVFLHPTTSNTKTHLFYNKKTATKKIKQTRPLRSVINICQKKLCLNIFLKHWMDSFFSAVPQLFPFFFSFSQLCFCLFFVCLLSVCLSSSQEKCLTKKEIYGLSQFFFCSLFSSKMNEFLIQMFLLHLPVLWGYFLLPEQPFIECGAEGRRVRETWGK